MRHFTNDEKLQFVALFDAVGAPDVLRLVATLVSDRHGRDDLGHYFQDGQGTPTRETFC